MGAEDEAAVALGHGADAVGGLLQLVVGGGDRELDVALHPPATGGQCGGVRGATENRRLRLRLEDGRRDRMLVVTAAEHRDRHHGHDDHRRGGGQRGPEARQRQPPPPWRLRKALLHAPIHLGGERRPRLGRIRS